MSGRVRSRSRSKQGREDRGSAQPAARVVTPPPTQAEQLKPKEKPTKTQDIIPDQGKEVEGAPVIQGPEMKSELQEVAQPMTGDKSEDGPDVKGLKIPNLEPIKMPEAGEGQSQV
ncbi:X antigen family member 5 isoform 1-T6 [Lycaon pictus]|uniref:GAGE domain-containing protein n=3 Tax=Canis lupus TaxID=9612 RepID=A0A8I3PZH3_CANLF|nr:P antigen family member 3-like [Canis lupus dingo]XP_025324388.1 P antigen family member 3-like [Canis lupus dingo]XP_025324389.1 P antigen family member 3-like [Canis lupus dingo]XP_025324390.1 P antigen family member 3-like [Canis lupus dingo]XP_025324391.1 P antigen family member 3-like [Canis lupus dingo]XP_025324392.1 P antigen family member 3-like [Canis lupus dingo]XP_038305973.1 P antigen family member 3-like [Canis lupus familiaris]XP_038305974.1 P antigen family member 3-like [C|eukprot:XP_005641425.1 P antigen family member 3-like [Canis lupus familiaris]